MIFLDLNNVEDIVFKNKNLRIQFPHFKYLFDSYDLGMVSISLKSLAMRCLNEFIKKCTDEDIKKLEEFLNDEVEISKLNVDPVLFFDGEKDNLEFELPEDYNCVDICIYRKKDNIKGLLWK
jgi:hypothetical protein